MPRLHSPKVPCTTTQEEKRTPTEDSTMAITGPDLSAWMYMDPDIRGEVASGCYLRSHAKTSQTHQPLEADKYRKHANLRPPQPAL